MPLQVIDDGLIQTDFMKPENRKKYSVQGFFAFAVDSKEKFSHLLFVFRKRLFFRNMASLRADDDPQASEYAGKDSPDEEGLHKSGCKRDAQTPKKSNGPMNGVAICKYKELL